jgi:hypothetical protein
MTRLGRGARDGGGHRGARQEAGHIASPGRGRQWQWAAGRGRALLRLLPLALRLWCFCYVIIHLHDLGAYESTYTGQARPSGDEGRDLTSAGSVKRRGFNRTSPEDAQRRFCNAMGSEGGRQHRATPHRLDWCTLLDCRSTAQAADFQETTQQGLSGSMLHAHVPTRKGAGVAGTRGWPWQHRSCARTSDDARGISLCFRGLLHTQNKLSAHGNCQGTRQG